MTDWFQYDIGHGFYPTLESSVLDSPHFANDIETPFHTELTAPLPGTVTKADFQSWGGEIFIKPDDTSKPTYYMYHLDTLDPAAHAGAHVALGQNLGLSGGENTNEVGSYPGSQHPTDPMWSTGPHTHIGWFDGYVTVPYESLSGEETATLPHGPDITPFILSLQHGGIGAGSGVNVPSSGQVDPYPGGSLNPANWPSEAQNTANSAATTVASDIANWINAKAGPFLLRVAVGSVGSGLIYLGTREVIDAMKSMPENFQKQRGEYKRGEVQERERKSKKEARDKETESKRAEREKQSEAKRQQRKQEREQEKAARKPPEKKPAAKKPAATEKTAKKAATAEKVETVAEVAV